MSVGSDVTIFILEKPTDFVVNMLGHKHKKYICVEKHCDANTYLCPGNDVSVKQFLV